MKKLIKAGLLLTLITFGSQASTLITADNLQRLRASLPAVQALSSQNELEKADDWQFAPHCNWQKHYQSLTASEMNPTHVKQFEETIKQHGFSSGAQYIELNIKISQPVWEESLAMMQQYQQQNNISADPTSAIGKSMQKVTQMYQVVTGCLTSDDKAALKRHQQQIREIMAIMAADDEDDAQFYDADNDNVQY